MQLDSALELSMLDPDSAHSYLDIHGFYIPPYTSATQPLTVSESMTAATRSVERAQDCSPDCSPDCNPDFGNFPSGRVMGGGVTQHGTL